MARRADAPHLHLETLDAWRTWLAEHHDSSSGAWLVSWCTVTGRPRIDYDDAVLEALAVGWIDGQAKTIDDERGAQWYAPRRPSSGWAASNKARVQRLEAEGRMQPAGRAAIDAAKANGTWSMFDDAERLIEPPELSALLDADPAETVPQAAANIRPGAR